VTDPTPAPTTTDTARRARTRSFVRHYLQMVAAMLVGMLVLHPVWMFLFPLLGWSVALERPDLHTLLMATDMTLGMTAWMRYRGHRWRPVAEMASAMYLPFVVLIGPLWAGLITGTTLFVAGHLLMLPAMLGVMLLRPHEYSGHPSGSPVRSC
jgi:hypothetical protein